MTSFKLTKHYWPVQNSEATQPQVDLDRQTLTTFRFKMIMVYICDSLCIFLGDVIDLNQLT